MNFACITFAVYCRIIIKLLVIGFSKKTVNKIKLMFYNSYMAITYRRFRFSHTMNSLKKVLMCLSVFAVIFMSFSCRNASDDESGDTDSNLDLESYIFLRHRFAEENATISSGDSEKDKLAWSKKHFDNAKDYMIEKVADFKHKVRDLEPEGNFLQPICDEVWTGVHGDDVNGYENGGSGIDPILGYNNSNYSKFLAATVAKLMLIDEPRNPDVKYNYDEYEKFAAHYAALAVRSYNDSLGRLRDSDKLTLNQERDAINTTLQSEPVNATYRATDYTLVEQNLRSMLERVSRKTGVSVDTLIDAVNLNLLNVGMWGARDLGTTAGFQLSSSDKLLRPNSQLAKLNRRDLLRNMGTWRKYENQYEKEQQSNQEQGKGL